MKRLLILFALALIGGYSVAQVKNKPKNKAKHDKYSDNIDDRMKGPHGEVIYIGVNGGRYYLKNGKKIYVALKKKK